MKSKKVIASLLSVAMLSTVAFAGCGNSSSKNTNSGSDASGDSAIDKDQYLNLILAAEPKTLDPSKATDSYSSQILAQVMETLTRCEVRDGKTEITPAAASEWKTSEDQLTWTFKLRDNSWSDGQAVTADQFVYGIQRTLDQNTASQYAFLLYPIKNAEAFNQGKAKAEDLGVKAVDDKTIEFTLERPCPYFLDLTYFKVMEPQRKDIIEKAGDAYGSEASTMVFCGPFVIDEWTHNSQVVLSKNDKYWDKDSVKLSKATFKIIKEEAARMNELTNGSLDLAGVSKQEWIKKFDETGNFNVTKAYDGSATYTFFNQQDKYFKNAKIRKAFSIVQDQAGMVSTLYRGLAEPATGWCPPQVTIGESEFRKAANSNPFTELQNENKDAKALLIEGLKEEGMDPDPAKHTFTYLESGTSATSKEFAEFYQNNFQKALGVKVNVDYVEWAIFQTRTDKFDYQIASMGWTGDYNDPNTFFDMFKSNAGIVQTGYKSEKYDKLIDDAANEPDQTKRMELFKQAEQLLIKDDCVITPGVWRFKNTYIRKYVYDYMSPTFGDICLKYVYTKGRA